MSFKNKVVLVTGASSGIGAAVAVAFSAEGAHVAMVGRNIDKLNKVAARCSKPLVLVADVGNDENARRIVDKTVQKFGQIDVLVNNAGLSRLSGLLDSNMMEAYDTIMNVNVRGLVHLTSLAAPHLVKTKGNVVNVSSVAALITPLGGNTINYYVSKAAVTHFGACAAAELAPHGIRVNTVSPGPVRTDFLENANVSADWDDFSAKTALNRVSEPEEIADVVLFLASDKAKGITGSDFLSDNGVYIKRP